MQSAIRLEPDGWEYYLRLAQFDRGDAPRLLETSLHLYPFDAEADIELALQYEARGDFAGAEKLLLDAYAVDHTWPPRWALANYYFRRDDMPKFWVWARRAAEMPTDDMGALFVLCWRVAPDPEKVSAAILNENPEMIRQYIGFLLAKDQLQAVANVAPHLVNSGDSETDLPLMFSVVDRLVAAGNGDSANALWRQLIRSTGLRRTTHCRTTQDSRGSRSPSNSTGRLLGIPGFVLSPALWVLRPSLPAPNPKNAA